PRDLRLASQMRSSQPQTPLQPRTLSRCPRRFLSTLPSPPQLFHLVFRLSFYSFRLFYQGSGWPRWKNPPLGPSSASVANWALVFPPSLTSIGAFGPPISVFTQPGCAEFTLILLSRNS